MRDALPIIYRLAIRNLEAKGVSERALEVTSPDVLFETISPHLDWIYSVTCFMAATANYSCTVRSTSKGELNGDQPPFHSAQVAIPLRPLAASNDSRPRYAHDFAISLQNLEREVCLAQRNRGTKMAWLARWIAAAALAASLATNAHGQLHVVALGAIAGENELSSGVHEQAFLAELPPEIIQAMPIHAVAEKTAYENYAAVLKQEVRRLAEVAPTSRQAMEGRGKIVNILSYLTGRKPPSVQSGRPWPRKLPERAAQWLIEIEICESLEDAKAFLQSINIVESLEARGPTSDECATRLPTKNSVDQAKHRGKKLFLDHWAPAMRESGILTRAMITRMTKSTRTIDALMAANKHTDPQGERPSQKHASVAPSSPRPVRKPEQS